MTPDLRDKTVEELHDFASQGTYASARPIVVEVIKEFKRRLSEAQQQIAEKDAALASCVAMLTQVKKDMDAHCVVYTDWRSSLQDKNPISALLNSLPASAKHNAEIIRAAEWISAHHNRLSGFDNREKCTCDLCQAVRAKKEKP